MRLRDPGRGLAVIGVLSERVEIETSDAEVTSRQSFARGEVLSPLEREPAAGGSGTRIHFWPDPTVFPWVRWDPTAIRERLRELAAFSPGLSFRFQPAAEALGPNVGLASLLPWRPSDEPHDALIEGAARWGTASCSFVLCLGNGQSVELPGLRSYCNFKRTTEGAHVAAFETAVGQAFARAFSDLPNTASGKAYERVAPDAVLVVDTLDPQYKAPIRDIHCTQIWATW